MADPAEIRRALHILVEPGGVTELRIVGAEYARGRVGTLSGYYDYDHLEDLVQAAAEWDGRSRGVYVTLNPVRPDVLARAANRLRVPVQQGESSTSDQDILRRRWLPIDLDPVRPSGVSSTDLEHDLALQAQARIFDHLAGLGWPEPVMADSGNGAHLLYRIDLPNNDDARQTVERVLKTLASQFSDRMVSIDTSVANAARIWKLYGTTSRKGDSTPERPHRLSRILYVPPYLAKERAA
ncbi:hypothetical protein [Caldinitratiruptor microaerophilus]|uniref:Uncharacterized protein n=1 Tax=Caldinitratiruptor microaerophilus TaxID=671077 RepID=A0AA35CM88_9FIRM|nr:hypothetical protein [Caldinitratiruptor microaerophilus]BDG59921.1 hypothetical protein caldi_10110 [Caldinitratiruptor microaerophilus]